MICRRSPGDGWAASVERQLELALFVGSGMVGMSNMSEDEWLPLIRAIDERLEPIAKRPVDIRIANWAAALQGMRPLEEAGVKPAAEELLRRLIAAYASGDDAERGAIRTLFRRFTSFAWAATLSGPKDTAAGLRERLLHFSIRDQDRDPRDATLWLDAIVGDARRAGVDINPLLDEVAALSSQADRCGWGSTADWLRRRKTSG
jgi:hypothetical protein